MRKEFKAAKGFFIYILWILFTIFFMLILTSLFIKDKKLFYSLAPLAGILMLLLYLFTSLKYLIDSKHFVIKISFLSIKFDLKKLEKVYYRRKFTSKFDKNLFLRINFNFYTDFKNLIILQFKRISVSISPEEPEKFIETLKMYNPQIEID